VVHKNVAVNLCR